MRAQDLLTQAVDAGVGANPRLALRCRLELACLDFETGRYDSAQSALEVLLEEHSPPLHGYDDVPSDMPLPEVDEIRCMLAQIAMNHGDISTAQSYYKLLGTVGTDVLNYDRRRLVLATDWPQLDWGVSWIQAKNDDMGPGGRKQRPKGRPGWGRG